MQILSDTTGEPARGYQDGAGVDEVVCSKEVKKASYPLWMRSYVVTKAWPAYQTPLRGTGTVEGIKTRQVELPLLSRCGIPATSV